MRRRLDLDPNRSLHLPIPVLSRSPDHVRELFGQRVAEAIKPLHVIMCEREAIDVWDKHAVDTNLLVIAGVSLDRLREFDRLQSRSKRPSKKAFDRAFQALLEVTEDAHGRVRAP